MKLGAVSSTYSSHSQMRLIWPVLILLLCGNLFAVAAQIGVGEYNLTVSEVVKALFVERSGDEDFVLLTLRLPRALVALLVGVGLAVSGTIIQSISNNSLASPGTLGINAGASLAAVTVIVVFPSVPIHFLPMVALLGGLTAAGVTYLFGWTGSSSPNRLILVGIGVGAFCTALMTIALVFGELQLVSQATIWISGSVYARSWDELVPLALWLGLLLPVIFLLYPMLDVVELGDSIAAGLGSHVARDRLILLILCVAVASVCVAITGPIGFVGLMAPHIARRLVGGNHRILLPTSALTGGLIVQCADLLGRVVFSPYEIACGIITAAIGAPFMIYLLMKN